MEGQLSPEKRFSSVVFCTFVVVFTLHSLKWIVVLIGGRSTSRVHWSPLGFVLHVVDFLF